MSVRIALILALVAGAAFGQDDKSKQEYATKLDGLRKKCARSVADVGTWVAGKKMYNLAIPCWEKAIGLEPDNAGARKGLGFKKQGNDWVPDPSITVKRGKEAPDAQQAAIVEECEKRLAKIDKTAGEDFYQLGKWAKGKKMAAETEESFRNAISWDGEHEAARKELGFAKENGVWVSADDKAQREAAKKNLAGAGEGEEWTEETDVEKELGVKLNKRKSARFRIWGPYDQKDLKETMRLAETTWVEFHKLMEIPDGQDAAPPPLDLVLLDTLALHEAYVDKLSGYPEGQKAWGKKMGGMMSITPPRCEALCLNRGVEYGKDFAIHATTHMLWGTWVGGAVMNKFAWLYEALAYYMSAKIHNSASTECIAQGTGGGPGAKSFGLPVGWKDITKKAIKDGTDPDIRATLNASVNTLNMERTVKAWSLLDWIFTTRKKEFFKFLAALQAGTDQEKALKESFGMDMGAMQGEWAKWALATY